MMYILTQEEFDKLRQTKAQFTAQEKAQLGTVCRMAAEYVPVNGKPLGCIHAANQQYCDDCIAWMICPLPRNYSK